MMNDLINKMEEYAQENDVPIMQKEGIEFLQEYIRNNEVNTILEIGSAIGYSAIQMCRMKENIKVVTIERDDDRYHLAVQNIKEAGLENRITIHHADALEIEIEGEFDFIFIDAAKAQYIKFFEKYKKNLGVNGVIMSDNLKFHGFVDTKERIKNRNTRQLVGKIKKYIDFLETNEEFETTFFDLGDGVALSKRK